MNLRSTTAGRPIASHVIGLALVSSLALAACGSSTSSSSPSTSASVSIITTTPSASSTTSSTPSLTTSASDAAGTGAHLTSAQLADAIRRATLGGATLVTVDPASQMASSVSELAKDRSDTKTAGTVSPAECRQAFLDTFVGIEGMTSANTAMGNNEKQKLILLATTASAPTPLSSSVLAACSKATMTEKGKDTSTLSLHEVPITTKVATDAHATRVAIDNDPMNVATARVGNTTIQAASGVSTRDLGQVLDALATQINKLG